MYKGKQKGVLVKAKDKDKFLVAIKLTSQVTRTDGKFTGEIRQGKILGRYRERAYADRDLAKLARNQGLDF